MLAAKRQTALVLGGMVLHLFEQEAAVPRFYREFAVEQPDELMTYASILTRTHHTRVLAPLRSFGSPIADMVGPLSYTAQ